MHAQHSDVGFEVGFEDDGACDTVGDTVGGGGAGEGAGVVGALVSPLRARATVVREQGGGAGVVRSEGQSEARPNAVHVLARASGQGPPHPITHHPQPEQSQPWSDSSTLQSRSYWVPT